MSRAKLIDIHRICIGCSIYLNAQDKKSLQYLALLELTKHISVCKLDYLTNHRKLRTLYYSQVHRPDHDFNLAEALPECTGLTKEIQTIPYRPGLCTRYPGHASQLMSRDGRILKIYTCRETSILDLW